MNFLFTFSTFSKFIDIALGCFYVSKNNYGSTANLSIFQNSFLGRFYFGKNEVDILRRPLKFETTLRTFNFERYFLPLIWIILF